MTFGTDFIWNIILTVIVGPIVWALAYVNRRVDTVDGTINSVWKTIAETRENIATSYVTKTDLHNDLNRILQRFDRLEEKLDRLTGDKR
jgi:predicted nucleotide-binding protein (sugar kinase/HSP70/actin superfamily)